MTYPLFLLKLLIRSGLAKWLPALERRTGGAREFLHYYSDRVLTAPYPELRQVVEFRDFCGPEVIDLALGSPRFDLAPSASTKLPADRRGLPPPAGLLELRSAVAEKLKALGRLRVQPAEEVVITPGVAGAFGIVLDAFVNPGDAVVLFDPCSPLYPFFLRPRRARIRWVPTWMEKGRTRFHLQDLLKPLRGARLIVVNSPANPTGGVLSPDDLEQIAWWANRRDVLIFNDEVYERFGYEGERVSVGALPGGSRRTLTAGSVSKGHALTSARTGWLAGHRHLVRPCTLTAALEAATVPTVCQQIALSALQVPDDAFAPIKEDFAARRRYGHERLESLGLRPIWPAGGFFIWLPVWELGFTGRAFAERLLQAKKVMVWPGEDFGPSGAGYVRLSCAGDDGRLREGLSRLADFVHEAQATPHSSPRRPPLAA